MHHRKTWNLLTGTPFFSLICRASTVLIVSCKTGRNTIGTGPLISTTNLIFYGLQSSRSKVISLEVISPTTGDKSPETLSHFARNHESCHPIFITCKNVKMVYLWKSLKVPMDQTTLLCVSNIQRNIHNQHKKFYLIQLLENKADSPKGNLLFALLFSSNKRLYA